MKDQAQGSTARAVSPDELVMVAWRAYKETEAYKNTIMWAGRNNEGGLWAAFVEGFKAGGGEVK